MTSKKSDDKGLMHELNGHIANYRPEQHFTLVDLKRLRNALADELVEEWHAGNLKEAAVPLHEWLGMTEAEYAEWVKNS